ncbi:GLPGLI family protein [[Muricauda] lutisoli]|uniref:GLPGLI family protein n=1 Tax=[Muricauda] lutisoli TaxID=2816035 RepID=A0ABS3EX70_9FLAO|nr:GLPGLI family protein [[Muricauda] lutisoli]MBO0330745.1 GLPGLI family protein [[Muricauda] lutisoli]
MKNQIAIYIGFMIMSIQALFAQITSGKILYNINMEDFYEDGINDGKISPELGRMFRMTADAANNIQLELLFNHEQSIFQHQKGLSISDYEELDDLVKMLTSDGTYYTDIKDGTQLLQTFYEGRKYNVKSEITKQDWTLTKEQKQIGKFVCYKAILDKSVTGLNENTKAWYAPEIPVSFGPIDYVGNLPGLILELKLPIATYTTSEIRLNPKKDIKIDWPNDIDTMTEEEYKKEGDKVKARLDEGW